MLIGVPCETAAGLSRVDVTAGTTRQPERRDHAIKYLRS